MHPQFLFRCFLFIRMGNKLIRNAEKHENKGDAFLNNDQYEKALKCYTKALKSAEACEIKDSKDRLQKKIGNH